MSATVTGSNVITLNQFNTGGPTGVALDTNAGWVYWANTTSGQYRLSRSNLDGSGFQGDIALPPDCNPAAGGIAIDGKLVFARLPSTAKLREELIRRLKG